MKARSTSITSLTSLGAPAAGAETGVLAPEGQGSPLTGDAVLRQPPQLLLDLAQAGVESLDSTVDVVLGLLQRVQDSPLVDQ